MNTRIVLARRPVGWVDESCFAVEACAEPACGPGDVLVGDEEGVVVIPRHLADEIAEPAAAQERMERFLLTRVEGGAALPGTYPPNEHTLAMYKEWEPGDR